MSSIGINRNHGGRRPEGAAGQYVCNLEAALTTGGIAIFDLMIPPGNGNNMSSSCRFERVTIRC